MTWRQNLEVLNSFQDQLRMPWVHVPLPPTEQCHRAWYQRRAQEDLRWGAQQRLCSQTSLPELPPSESDPVFAAHLICSTTDSLTDADEKQGDASRPTDALTGTRACGQIIRHGSEKPISK